MTPLCQHSVTIPVELTTQAGSLGLILFEGILYLPVAIIVVPYSTQEAHQFLF